MLVRLTIKVLIIILISLVQASGAYTITPPQVLAGFSHIIFPISLFLLFSPEIAEISDMKEIIGEIQFKILTFITTAISILPIVFIKKIILLEYNWLDSVPLKFGFNITRTWTPEEKFKFLETTLNNIGADSLLTSTQKLNLSQQSNTMAELQTNLMNFLQQQAATQTPTTWSLGGLLPSQYIIGGILLVGIAAGGYFMYANSQTIWAMYNSIKSLGTSGQKLNDSVASTVSVISRDHDTIVDLRNAMQKLIELTQAHNKVLDEMAFLMALTPDDVSALKVMFKQLANNSIKFCKCTASEGGRRLGGVTPIVDNGAGVTPPKIDISGFNVD